MWFEKQNAMITVNWNLLLCVYDRRMSSNTRTQTSMLMDGSGSHEGRANDQSRSHFIGAVCTSTTVKMVSKEDSRD